MTILFEEFKARLLADPKVKAEYDALAPELDTGETRTNSALDQNLAALCRGDRQ